MMTFIVVAFVSVGIFSFVGPALSPGWNGPPWFLVVLFVAIIVGNGLWICSQPHKIVLDPDGTIAFISILRIRNLSARDILSIKPEGTTYGFLVVRTERSKIRIIAQFDGFHDFLARLKAMNPAVELRGC
jgi:hypothetical protein